MTKSDIASATGHSATSGTFLKLLATLKGFGLIRKEGKNNHYVSELGIKIKNTTMNGRVRQQLALKAIRNAPVFDKLLAQFDTKIPPPESIRRRLEEDMGFSEGKAREAAQVFVESLGDSGVLDSQNNLVLARGSEEHPEDVDAQLQDQRQARHQPDLAPELAPAGAPRATGEMLTTDVPLSSGRSVRIQYPNDLTASEASRIATIIGLMVVADHEGDEGGEKR